MPRGRKKKSSNPAVVNPIGRKPKRDQQDAIDLTSEMAETDTVMTPTPKVQRMRTRLTLSQPAPTQSPLSSQAPKPKPSVRSSLSKSQDSTSVNQVLAAELDDSDNSGDSKQDNGSIKSVEEVIELPSTDIVEPDIYDYVVMMKVFYDIQTTVFETTLMCQSTGPKKFTYISAWVTAITKAKVYAEGLLGSEPPCFFISAAATVKWQRSPKTETMVFALESHGYGASWAPVETALGNKYTAGKKELAVLLEFRFARTKSGLAPPKPPSLNSLKRQEKEERMAKDAKLVADFNDKTIEALDRKKALLMEKWMCNKATCPNNTGWCWIRPRDSMHLKVDRPHFVLWNNSIEKGNGSATVERPPENILGVLPVQEKKTRGIRNVEQNPFGPSSSGTTPHDLYMMTIIAEREERAERRRREEKNRENELTALRFPQSVVGPTYGAPPIYGAPSITHPYTYQPVPRYTMSPYQLPQPGSNPEPQTPNALPVARSRTLSTLPDAKPMRPSSPVEGNNVEEYVQWHIQNRDVDREGFLFAASVLKDGGYDLQTIQDKHRGLEWMHSLGIKEGVAIQLRRDITKFSKYQKQRTKEAVLTAPKPRALSLRASRAPSLLHDAQVPAEIQEREGIDEYPVYHSDTTTDYDSDDLDRPINVSSSPLMPPATQFIAPF